MNHSMNSNARTVFRELRRLWPRGYCGRMGAILERLKRDVSHRDCRGGGFHLARIADLGKAYRLAAHLFVAER